jgi:hypothetical protein
MKNCNTCTNETRAPDARTRICRVATEAPTPALIRWIDANTVNSVGVVARTADGCPGWMGRAAA